MHMAVVESDKWYRYPLFEPDQIDLDIPNISAGWSVPEARYVGGVLPDRYQHPDIICSKAATNALTSVKVAAGSDITFQWNAFDRTHHGPVMTYLANCNGKCETVDKTALEFFKIDELGILEKVYPTGEGFQAQNRWAADQLDDQDNTWTSKIPATIAPGNYVVRHERIALHDASHEGGAQNYPNCINLEITSDGTENPPGVKGMELYTSKDPGLWISIYEDHDSYPIPGPPLYQPGSSSPKAASEPNPPSSPSSPQSTPILDPVEVTSTPAAASSTPSPTTTSAPESTISPDPVVADEGSSAPPDAPSATSPASSTSAPTTTSTTKLTSSSTSSRAVASPTRGANVGKRPPGNRFSGSNQRSESVQELLQQLDWIKERLSASRGSFGKGERRRSIVRDHARALAV